MTTATIRQKLYEYIRFADDKKVKAIYKVVSGEVNDSTEWWQNKELLAQVLKADADMESGIDKGVSWKEAKEKLTARGKK